MSKRKSSELNSAPAARIRHEKLCGLSRQSFLSQSALASILTSAKSGGLPEAFSRGSQHRARKNVCHTETPYGPILNEKKLKLIQGPESELDVGFQNPMAWLHYHCEHSNTFSKIVQGALQAHPSTPSSPWSIILYEDGVDPGDQIGKNKSRHSVVYYWSFLELGMEALCHEEVWGTATIMRTNKAKHLEGGLPELTHRVLEQFHGDVHDIRISGVSVCCQGSENHSTIFAKTQVLMSDAPALAEMLSAKGHAALKCCCLCMNATHHKPPGGATPIHEFSDYCVPITCTDFNKFKKHTDASLRQSIQHLNDLKAQLSSIEDQETTVYGYNWTPWSIILNKKFDIGVASAVMYDWAHTYVCDGVADQEFGAFMKVMHASITKGGLTHSCTYQALGEYLSGWAWPKGRGNPMHLFDPEHAKRFIRSGDFACTASEFLSLAPVIKRFLEQVVSLQTAGTHVHRHVESMIAVLDVIDLLQACKVKHAVRPEKLYAAIQKHLDLFKQTYGTEMMRPKHHYALHLPDMLARFGVLLATLTAERKHRAVKRYSRGRINLHGFEIGVLEEVTCHNMWELCEKHVHAFSTSKPSRRQQWWLQDLFPESNAKLTLHNEVYRNGYIKQGDIVAFEFEGDLRFGKLLVNVGIVCEASAELVSIVSLWEHPSGDAEFASCSVFDESVKVPTTCLVEALLYHMTADCKSCVVAVPYALRARTRHARHMLAAGPASS